MWDKLSMADRAKYIQLGVANGVTSLDEIKDTYNKYAEGGPKRVRANTSPTAELSTKLEDVVATKIRNDKHINHAYDIPYLQDKETKIIGYTVPTNALDSIAKYAGKTKHDLDEAVALAFESGYGRQPYFNYGTKNISDRAIGNMNYFKNYGSIPSHLFVRDYEYTTGGYNKGKPYTNKAPLEHAIEYYRSGRYNTKLRAVDPETGKTINHTQKVKLEAKKLRKDPNYQKWKKQSGLDEYTGKAQQARDRQKAIDAENARKAKYRKEHPIKAYFKDALGIKYDDGGYLNWKRRIQKYKGLDVDNDDTYDYEGFYKSNPARAWGMLEDKPDAHFTDEFKTSTHPTFSVESRYSGNKNQFNPNGLTGGIWDGDYKYIMSQDMIDTYNGDISYTRDYLDRHGPGVTIYNPEGDIMLRPITIRPKRIPHKKQPIFPLKYDDGGLLTKADELAYINPSLVSWGKLNK